MSAAALNSFFAGLRRLVPICLIAWVLSLTGCEVVRAPAECVSRLYSPAIVLVRTTFLRGGVEEAIEGTGFIINGRQGMFLTSNHIAYPEDAEVIRHEARLLKDMPGAPWVTVAHLRHDADVDAALLQFVGVQSEMPQTFAGVSERAYAGALLTLLAAPDGRTLQTVPVTLTSATARRYDNAFGYYMVSERIEGGMSGSPVFDSSGLVIGIAAASDDSWSDSGYFMPIDLVRAALVADRHWPQRDQAPAAVRRCTGRGNFQLPVALGIFSGVAIFILLVLISRAVLRQGERAKRSPGDDRGPIRGSIGDIAKTGETADPLKIAIDIKVTHVHELTIERTGAKEEIEELAPKVEKLEQRRQLLESRLPSSLPKPSEGDGQ